MGFLWDLIQHNQISDQRSRTSSMEARVGQLERELDDTRRTLQALMERLEKHFGEDIDGDGRVG